MKKDMLDLFVYFINEREAIRLRKASGKLQPWTKDKHLAEWRFCNVNRCEDRETRWIFKYIIKPHHNSPTLWFNLAIARFINWSPSLGLLGYFEDWGKQRGEFIDHMSMLFERGGKVYTGAYMIRAGTGEDAKMPKHQYLAKRVFDDLWERREGVPDTKRCEDWSEFLGQTFGMGDFMRNQVITDYKYSHILPKAKTVDWKTFVLAGPGTLRGLNRLYGNGLKETWNPGAATKALLEVRELINPRWKGEAGTFDDLNNLSNCFCEFDKYIRLTNNEGQPRSRYQVSGEALP